MPAIGAAIGGAVALLTGPLLLPVLLGFGAVAIGIGLSGLLGTPAETVAQAGGVEYDAKAGEDTVVACIFGRQITAGMLIYHQEYGTDNEYIQLVFQLGYGVYDSLNGLYVDKELKATTGSNGDTYGKVVTAYTTDSTPHMWVKFYDGDPAQSADAELITNSAGRWTTDHRGVFNPYIIIRMRYDEELFGSSMPSFLFDIKGLKLYDPRLDDTQTGGAGDHRWGDLDTYEWSENPSVCLYNYKRGIWHNDVLVLGEGRNEYGVSIPYFNAASNLSDEMVDFPDTSNSLPRYHVGVEISDGTDDQTVTQVFESAMGGYGVEIGGAYRPLPGQQQTPVMTIEDDDIDVSSTATGQTRLPPASTYTAVGGNFTDITQNWQQSTYGVLEDTAVDDAEGGQRLLTMDIPMVHQIETAQMLAEIQRRRDRFQKSEQVTVRPTFGRLEPGDVITRDKSLFGVTPIPMLVQSVEELENMTVRLELRHLDNSIFPASDEAFMDLPDDVGSAPAGPDRILQLQGLSLTAVGQIAGSTLKAAIKVVWDPITDPTVDRVVLKYWPTAGTEADDSTMVSIEDTTTTATILSPLLPLTNYTVIAIIYTTPARATFWTDPETVTTTDEVVAAEIPDGSIDYLKLAQDLQNLYDFTVGGGAGTLFDKISNIEARIAAQESASLTDQMNNRSDTKLLKVVSGNSAAAIINEARVRADGDSALASQITSVLTQLGNIDAGAVFAIQSLIEGGGASATISMVVRASVDDDFSEGAIRLIATAEGGGVTSSEVQIMADRFVFITVDGDIVTQPFAIDDGDVVIQEMKFRRLTSIATTVGGDPIMVFDGDTGAFSITID